MKNTLWISLVVVGLLVAVFFVGKRQKWFGGIDPELEEKEPAMDPEPNYNPNPPTKKPSGTNTSTTGTGTSTKTVNSKKVALDPTKPKPAPEFNAPKEAQTIANWLSDWTDLSGNDVKAFNKILIYRENELRAVHNAWIDKYSIVTASSNIKNTLRSQIKAEAVWNNRTDAVNKKALCLKRLDDFKIP